MAKGKLRDGGQFESKHKQTNKQARATALERLVQKVKLAKVTGT